MQAAYETLITRGAGNSGGERHPARFSLGKIKKPDIKTAQSFTSYLDEGNYLLIKYSTLTDNGYNGKSLDSG